MGIKNTKKVSRFWAIKRITTQYCFIKDKRYKDFEKYTCEESSAQMIINSAGLIDIDNLDNWTNSMLGELLDKPGYRESMFDNYLVVEDDDI